MARTFLASLLILILTATPLLAGSKEAPPRVKLETSMGDIILILNPEKAPATVANFLAYVRDGYYDGTIFRCIRPVGTLRSASTDPNSGSGQRFASGRPLTAAFILDRWGRAGPKLDRIGCRCGR